MELKRKKKMTYFTIGLIFLLSGMEYAVILPTIWRYLQTLGAAPYFLGLGLSAFSLSGLLSGPLFGHWSDKTHATKKIILFANLFEIVGNFMYFMGYSKWLLISSRLVAGVGTGAGSSIFGFMGRCTAHEDRSTVFASVMACRQIGLMIGPVLNLFLRLCDFKLGPFVVNKYTAPGLFMCFMWTLLQLVVVFMFWDLPPLEELVGEGAAGGAEGAGTVEEAAGKPLLGQRPDILGSYGSVVTPDPPRSTANPSKSNLPHVSPTHSPPLEGVGDSSSASFSMSREFLREEVVVLFTAHFVILFNQTALETVVTPLTQQYFNFGELENSIIYCICSVEVITGFLFVHWLCRRTTERVVLAVGLILCHISCVWCLIFLANPQGNFPWQLAEFIIGVFLQISGLPFVAVAQVCLFSKITSVKSQGLSQGVRRSVGGLATILGPLWGGGLTGHMYIMLGLMMALLALFAIMFSFSYPRLVAPTVVDHADCLEECDKCGGLRV
ncbi:major facilitator superfamily domain-containing protein 8-like [Oncorhynchus clarkii lewisi]|uniref:major facilitator superfamily domain-containing protein 8-like n=1 Tax=Oncorhynchus clarkii lewisi TaxID=490388 RepID=UPI0039B92A1C